MKIQDLAPIAIVFVIAGVVLGVGADILVDIEDSVDDSALASAAVNNSTEGLAELASWLPTIALIVAAAIVIGVIFTSFRPG